MYCDVFYKKDLMCEIDINFVKETVSFTNYTDKIPLLPFGTLENDTIQDFMDFVEDRVMPQSRYSIEILKYNHGLCTDDEIWIRFDGEEVNYDEEIKPFFDIRNP